MTNEEREDAINFFKEVAEREIDNAKYSRLAIKALEIIDKHTEGLIGYIHIDDVYRLIAGHSNYHGDSILSALTCIAEGKNVTKPIAPLDKEDCSFEKMPSVTPKEKTRTGKWIDDYKNEIDDEHECSKHFYRCSECGKYADQFVDGIEDLWDTEKPNFCPNCGAKMEGE